MVWTSRGLAVWGTPRSRVVIDLELYACMGVARRDGTTWQRGVVAWGVGAVAVRGLQEMSAGLELER